jgi:hypothetical protein
LEWADFSVVGKKGEGGKEGKIRINYKLAITEVITPLSHKKYNCLLFIGLSAFFLSAPLLIPFPKPQAII